MQLHCDGLWARLRVGNCLASYLGIAAIDAAHKSARRAQDVEATGTTFERERESRNLGKREREKESRNRETDMLTVCVAPGSKNVSFFSRNFWGVATVCDMFWFVSPMFMGLCCRERAMRPTRCRCRCSTPSCLVVELPALSLTRSISLCLTSSLECCYRWH